MESRLSGEGGGRIRIGNGDRFERASERGIWNEILNEDGDTMGKSFVGKRKRYIYLYISRMTMARPT